MCVNILFIDLNKFHVLKSFLSFCTHVVHFYFAGVPRKFRLNRKIFVLEINKTKVCIVLQQTKVPAIL